MSTVKPVPADPETSWVTLTSLLGTCAHSLWGAVLLYTNINAWIHNNCTGDKWRRCEQVRLYIASGTDGAGERSMLVKDHTAGLLSALLQHHLLAELDLFGNRKPFWLHHVSMANAASDWAINRQHSSLSMGI